jgi:hypothetical protein
MLLEKEIKVVREKLVGCNENGLPEFKRERVVAVARGCTQIELDQDIDRLHKYYNYNFIDSPKKNSDTKKVTTSFKGYR